MPNITGPAFAFPTRSFPTNQAGIGAGAMGELPMSEVLGKYATMVKAGKVFYASAAVSAPVIFSTAAQLGPMLWNKPGSGIDAHILAVAVANPTTASTVAGALGWSSNNQTTAPVTPTAITAVNAYAGGPVSAMGAINSVGTVIILPVPIFLPLIGVNTAAITAQSLSTNYADIGGALIVSPGNVGYVCASATLTTSVYPFIGLLWAELPV